MTRGGLAPNPQVGLDQGVMVLVIPTEGTSSQEAMMTPLHPTRTAERETNHPRTGGQVSGVVQHWVALRLTY